MTFGYIQIRDVFLRTRFRFSSSGQQFPNSPSIDRHFPEIQDQILVNSRLIISIPGYLDQTRFMNCIFRRFFSEIPLNRWFSANNRRVDGQPKVGSYSFKRGIADLSMHIRSTKRLEIANPSRFHHVLRECETSVCVNGSNNFGLISAGMPSPVS